MAVAHSAASESHAATTGSVSQTSFTWTHTQTGTPQGVLVFVHVANSTGNPVSSVTYGSVTLTRVSGGAAVDSAGEQGRTDLFFAGSGLASGNQTITVNRSNTTDIMYASAATVTALTDTNVTGIVLLEGDGTLTVQSVTDGGAPTNSLRYAAAYSGLASPPPAGTGSTLLNSIDFGNYGIALVRETTAGTGARNVGFNNATTDDRAAVHVAVRELWNRTDTETVGAFTLTGQPNTLARGRVMTGERGAFDLTGQPADLRHNPDLEASPGAFTLSGQPADLRIGHAIAGDVGKFFLPERNQRQWSEEFNNAYWTKSQASITPNATIAPDGTLTADALIENSTPSIGHQITRNITYVTGKTYTHSCYFKLYPGPITRYVRLQLGSTTVFGSDVYANINLATGVVTNTPGLGATTSVTNVGNDWYRASISLQYTGAGITTGPAITLISTAGTSLYTDADGLSGAYLWGVQWEESTSVTDYDPTGPAGATDAALRQAYRLDGGVGAFTFTGRSADTLHNARIDGGTETFSLVGQPATLTEATPKAIVAETGTFTLTGNPATVRRGYALAAATGTFTTAGQPATLRHNPRIEANTGSFALSGGAPSLLRGRYLSGGAGEFIETGQPTTFRRTWTVQAATGAFSFTGNPAALTELGAYEIAATVGAFTLSGQPANLAQSQTMPVSAGTFNFTGQPATLRQSQALAAETGAFAISGQPAGLTQGYQLNLLAGVFALSSNGVAFRRTWAVAPESGAFAITGSPAVLTEQGAFGIEAGSGSFALTGNNASLAQSRTLPVTAGGFSLTGTAATLSALRAVQLTATATVFTVSGNAATLRTSHLLSATFGSFALTGNNASLSDTDELFPATGIYVLTGYAAALSKTTAIRRRNVLIF